MVYGIVVVVPLSIFPQSKNRELSCFGVSTRLLRFYSKDQDGLRLYPKLEIVVTLSEYFESGLKRSNPKGGFLL